MIGENQRGEQTLAGLVGPPSSGLKNLTEIRDALRDHEALYLTQIAETLMRVAEIQAEATKQLATRDKPREDDWLTHSQMARRLKISETKLYEAVKAQEIPRHRATGNVYLYYRPEVDQIVRTR